VSTQSQRSFTLLWISQAFSQLGTSVSSLAYPLLLLGITGSAAVAGLAGTVVAVVALGVRVPGGIVADRYRHKALMLVSDAARTVVVAAVGISVLLDAVSVPFVLIAMALEVACGAAFGPAEFALVRMLVPAHERALAVGRMQSRSQLAGLIGPALGGALYGVAPFLPFLADAASYAISFCLVLGVRSPAQRAGQSTAFVRAMGAGWRWLRAQPFLFAGGFWVSLLVAAFAAVGLAVLVVARDRGATSAEIGLMYAISTAGGLVGALVTPALQSRYRPAVIFRAAAVIDCAATLAILPLTSPYLIGLAGAAAFFLAPAVTASLFGTLSTLCPDELVGRAQASLGLVVGAAAPIAPVVIGIVLDAWGPTVGIAVLAAAFACLACAAFVIPAFRPTLNS